MAMNFENMVRCNNCMKSFHENEIVYAADVTSDNLSGLISFVQ